MALFLSSPHNVSNAHRRSTPRGNTIRQTDCVSGREVKGQSEAVWVRSRPGAVLRTKQVLTVWIQPGVTSQRSLPLSLCHSPVTSSSPLSLFLFHLLLFTSFLPHLNFQSLRFTIAAHWRFSLVDVMFAPAKKKAVSENKAKIWLLMCFVEKAERFRIMFAFLGTRLETGGNQTGGHIPRDQLHHHLWFLRRAQPQKSHFGICCFLLVSCFLVKTHLRKWNSKIFLKQVGVCVECVNSFFYRLHL